MQDRPKTNVLWWAVPAATVIVLAIFGMFGGVKPPERPPANSTLDASAEGTRAVYLLLDGLGYNVATSRRPGAGHVRWVLFPANDDEQTIEGGEKPTRPGVKRRNRQSEVESLRRWVEEGGTLLVADDSPASARSLDLQVKQTHAADLTMRLNDDRPLELAPGPVDFTPQERPDRNWPARGEPLASIFRRGRGEIWFVNHPGIMRNERIRDAENAVAVCRLAEATGQGGTERIYFDEFFHGLRDRPGAMQLLFQPPALWVTLQGLGVLALLLWRFLPRFGPFRDATPIRRRSKEEFLDAMTYLLTRKGAYSEAAGVIRDTLARDLELALGLPPASGARDLAACAARRRPGLNETKLALALSRNEPLPDRGSFLRALNELESLRREFFHE